MPAAAPGRTTPVLGAILVALALFAGLATAVAAGSTLGFDARVLLAIPRGPEWLFRAMRDITALGDTPVLTLVTCIAAGHALVRRRVRAAVFVGFTVAVGAIIDTQLKLVFARPRPAVVPHLVDVSSASFPSGHAMNSAVVCFILGALLISGMRDRGARAYVACVAIALAAIIGASRVYLGVHYPTDVIGGWLAGGAWAAACWLVAARRLGLAPIAGGALPLAVHPAKARRP